MNAAVFVGTVWVGALAYTVIAAMLYRDIMDIEGPKYQRGALIWSSFWPITMILVIIAVFVLFLVVLPFKWVVKAVLGLGNHR